MWNKDTAGYMDEFKADKVSKNVRNLPRTAKSSNFLVLFTVTFSTKTVFL